MTSSCPVPDTWENQGSELRKMPSMSASDPLPFSACALEAGFVLYSSAETMWNNCWMLSQKWVCPKPPSPECSNVVPCTALGSASFHGMEGLRALRRSAEPWSSVCVSGKASWRSHYLHWLWRSRRSWLGKEARGRRGNFPAEEEACAKHGLEAGR